MEMGCKFCSFCNNAFVDPELNSDNDLSYLSLGEMCNGYSIHMRSGAGRDTVLVISKLDRVLHRFYPIGIYKMKFCPECGRELIENSDKTGK